MAKKNTMIDLITELRDFLEHKKQAGKDVEAIDKVILRAEHGDYHDWKSDYATPKINLVQDLQIIGAYNLKRAVMNGEYDEDMDAEDEGMMNALITENFFPEGIKPTDTETIRRYWVNRRKVPKTEPKG